MGSENDFGTLGRFPMVALWAEWLKSQNVIFSETLQTDTEKSLKKALDIYEQRKYIERVTNEIDEEKSEIIYNILENRRPGLDYYKNNCINHFMPASITAIAIFSHDSFNFMISDLKEGQRVVRRWCGERTKKAVLMQVTKMGF